MLLAVLGCLATQGGPIWWASKHRAHHKFCDKPRDPHCPKLRGMIGAFAWFGKVRPPPQARPARSARAMLRPGAWPKHRLEHTLEHTLEHGPRALRRALSHSSGLGSNADPNTSPNTHTHTHTHTNANPTLTKHRP